MTRSLFASVVTFFALAAPAQAATVKVEICHRGDTGPVTINVAQSAVRSHLRQHGDSVGECGGGTCTQVSWHADADRDGFGDPNNIVMACDAPAGYVASSTDCDDTRAGVNPAGAEACDGLDDDCDGAVDEAGALGESTWYADADADGYGDAGATAQACDAPTGFVGDAGDCDDAAAGVNPGADEACNGDDDDCDTEVDEAGALGESTWYADADADGYGDAGATVLACEAPEGFGGDDLDCDDGDAGVNPGATEACNDVDDDCDGVTDEAGSAGEATWYTDADGDGFGSTGTTACDQPAGTVADGGDCDDADAATSPGGVEVCDASDNDCDGTVDGLDECSFYWVQGNPDGVTWWEAATDCEDLGLHLATINDADERKIFLNFFYEPERVWVGAQRTSQELLLRLVPGYTGDGWSWADGEAFGYTPWADGEPSEGAGEDCGAYDVGGDGMHDLDCETLLTWWVCEDDGRDAYDGDGDGYTWGAGDCDDVVAGVSPGRTELCDGFDDDCDGLVDEDYPGETATFWFLDVDGDGYGVWDTLYPSCDPVLPEYADGVGDELVAVYGDCDETDPEISPGAPERCNGIDDDCDGEVDEGTFYADADGDGYNGGTPVVCTGVESASTDDSDCDDTDVYAYPGALDVCMDGLDRDCDGADDACSCPCYEAEDIEATWTMFGGASTSIGWILTRDTPLDGMSQEIQITAPNGAFQAFTLEVEDDPSIPGFTATCGTLTGDSTSVGTPMTQSINSDEYYACTDELFAWFDTHTAAP